MLTILGSGGAIGVELAKVLKDYSTEIRLVSRNPKKVNASDELFPADITVKKELEAAVKGSDVVYVTVGFEYNHAIWAQKWPKFIKVSGSNFGSVYDDHEGVCGDDAPIQPGLSV